MTRAAYVAHAVKVFTNSGQATDPDEFRLVAIEAGEHWDRRARLGAAIKDMFAAHANGERLPIEEFLDALEAKVDP